MTTQPPQGDFPPVHPTGTDATQFVRPEWLLQLPNFLSQLIEKIVGLVVQAIVGIFLPGPIGSAFNQLTNWATNLLPAQILEPISLLVDLLVTVLNSIPIIGPPLGNAIEDLAAMFGLLNDNTNQANSTNNPAVASSDSRIAALEALVYGSGSGGFDDFNDPPLSAKWSAFAGVPLLTVSGGHVTNSGVRRGARFNASLAATKKYKCQSALVDFATGTSRMGISGNSTYSSYCAVDVDRASSHAVTFRLGHCTSPSSSAMTVQDSHALAAGALKEADVLMLQCEEDYAGIVGQNRFTVYLTQTAETSPMLICEWLDTANTVGTDGTTGHRHMALFTCIDANGSQPGCGWDVWSYADIP